MTYQEKPLTATEFARPVRLQFVPRHLVGVLLRTLGRLSGPFPAAPDLFPFPRALAVAASGNWPGPRGVGHGGQLHIPIELLWPEDEDQFQFF